jgi:hypothetical protein
MMLPLLPVDVADPVARLRTVHRRMRALKVDKEAEAGATILALARQQPFAPVSWLIRLAARTPAPKKASRKAAAKAVPAAVGAGRRAAPAAGRRPAPARTRSGKSE